MYKLPFQLQKVFLRKTDCVGVGVPQEVGGGRHGGCGKEEVGGAEEESVIILPFFR